MCPTPHPPGLAYHPSVTQQDPLRALKPEKNTTKITRFDSAVSFIGKEGNSKDGKNYNDNHNNNRGINKSNNNDIKDGDDNKKKNNNRKSGGRDGFASWISAFSTSSWIEFPIL